MKTKQKHIWNKYSCEYSEQSINLMDPSMYLKVNYRKVEFIQK